MAVKEPAPLVAPGLHTLLDDANFTVLFPDTLKIKRHTEIFRCVYVHLLVNLAYFIHIFAYVSL